MRITADTNVLVRAVINDDHEQAKRAARLLARAEWVAVTLPSLCEFVWVLRSTYQISVADVITAIRALLDAASVRVNRPAAEAGLAALEAGGDFADGVIAFEGQMLGGDTFVSFDKKAVSLLNAQGLSARLP